MCVPKLELGNEGNQGGGNQGEEIKKTIRSKFSECAVFLKSSSVFCVSDKKKSLSVISFKRFRGTVTPSFLSNRLGAGPTNHLLAIGRVRSTCQVSLMVPLLTCKQC